MSWDLTVELPSASSGKSGTRAPPGDARVTKDILARHPLAALLVLAFTAGPATAFGSAEFDVRPILEVSLDGTLGQLRAAPVTLGSGQPRAFVVAYGEDFDVDPYHEMFFYPEGTLKLAVITEDGEILWSKDRGRGVVPWMWFTPFFPFDLDDDGVDEIWFVNNPDPDHPLALSKYRLERLDPGSGQSLGDRPWPRASGGQSISHTYRNFILGGYVQDEPVLVTAQGTYGPMAIQAWNRDGSSRWVKKIGRGDPGARGSHRSPIADMNGDGVQEMLWGERLIELDQGREIFCADCARWQQHSDIIQPFLDRDSGRWYVYTAREKDVNLAPRVVVYDERGEIAWSDIERGHMDMGWVARSGPGELTAMAIRIQSKALGPGGRTHRELDEFAFDALTGDPRQLPFSTYRTVPVDLDGDGIHELVYGGPGADGRVIDWDGKTIATVSGTVAMASKFLDHPGEQLLVFHTDGTLEVWADLNAQDGDPARERYADPLYRANQRLTGVGSNLTNLGGL